VNYNVRHKLSLNKNTHNCPNCGNEMVLVKASLNRSWTNALLFGFGSSELKIKSATGKHNLTHMLPSRDTQGSYCTACGALLLAPSVKSHLRTLDDN